MKKIMILVLLFCVVTLFSDIHGEFEAGRAIEEEVVFAKVTIEYDFEFDESILKFYGSWLSWFQCTGQIFFFTPYQIIYSVGAEYKLNNLFFDVSHFCNHPVYSGYGVLEDLKRGENMTTISAGITW